MAFFKVRVGETTYELDKLTLGDARVLKRDFGLKNLEVFDPSDPDQLVGLLALAIHRADPDKTIKQATAEAEALDIEGFADESDAEADEDPTPASGGSGKRGPARRTTGTRS